jgi:hypothetical protein
MPPNVIDCVTSFGIRDENAGNQITHGGGEGGREGETTCQDLVVELRDVGVLEGEIATDQGIENDAHAPHVGGGSMVGQPSDHLRARVARRPTGGREELTPYVSIGEAEVNDLDAPSPGGTPRRLQQQILRLEIAMGHLHAM